MGTERTIPVALSRRDAQYFTAMADEQRQSLSELLRSILEAVAEDDRKAGT